MLRTLRLVSAMGLLTVAPAVHAQQAATSNLVVILDGSGSMWGKAGDERKITAAKRVMSELLKDVPAQVRLGLVAYGHRRKGDCRDIETIAAPGARPADIAAAVRRIEPTGKTPITDALATAADEVKNTDVPSTILLVSDGIETCQGDPCALAAKLKASGARLIVHTVGFGVGDKAASQLQCIAAKGGGNYYQADDAEALKKALFAVKKAVAENKTAPAVEPVKVVQSQKLKTKRIKIGGPATIKLKLASWAKLPYRWHVVEPETGKPIATASKIDTLKVAKGEYQIVWRQSQHQSSDLPLSEVVTAPAGKTVTVNINTGLQLIPPQGLKAPYWWALVRDGEKRLLVRFSGRASLNPQVTPAGAYRLVWHQHQHQSRPVDLGGLTIEPGKLNQVRLATGVRIRLADWIKTPPYRLVLIGADGKVAARWSGATATGVQLAGPGVYRVRYQQTQHDNSPIDLGPVTVPASGFADIKVNTGVKFIAAEDAEAPYRAIFVNLDNKKKYIWYGHNKKAWTPIPLPPGRYRLDWWEHQHKTKPVT